MPDETASLSLLDALSETGFQASVIASYCCYFPFYEEVVLRRLLDKGCTNNILIVDGGICAEAFASEDTRPRRAWTSRDRLESRNPWRAPHSFDEEPADVQEAQESRTQSPERCYSGLTFSALGPLGP